MPLGLTIWSIIAVAVGAGILAVVVSLLFAGRSLAWRALAFLLVGLPLGAFAGHRWGTPLVEELAWLVLPRTEQQRLAEDMGKRLERVPEWQARARQLTRRQQWELAMRLAASGTARLDDAALRDRARLFAEVLRLADEATCVALARGTASPGQMQDAIFRLSPDAFRVWLDLAHAALVAELRAQPLPPTDLNQEERALQALLERVPDGERARMADIVTRHRPATDAEACWAARAFYAALVALDEPHRSILARMVVRG